MTEYDDALLEDDILSLPDISDVEDDFSHVLNNSDHIKSKDETSFCDLEIFDAFEECVDEENNIKFRKDKLNSGKEDFCNEQEEKYVKPCADGDLSKCHKNNNYESEAESTSTYFTTGKNDCLKTDLRTSLKNNIQNIMETTTKIKHDDSELSNRNEIMYSLYSDNNERHQQFYNARTHLYQLNDQNIPDTRYQSCQNYQQPGSQYIPSTADFIANASFDPLKHNQHYVSSLGHQSYYSYNNQNFNSNNGIQSLPPHDSMHSLNLQLPMNNILPFNESSSNSIFTLNQKLSVNQVLPFSQGLSSNQYLQSSIMTNEVIASNQYVHMMGNPNNLALHCSSQSSHFQHSLNNDNVQSRYLMNPLEIHNNLNVQKILINRNFTQNITREVKITNNTVRYEEFLKNNSKVSYPKTNRPPQDTKTHDPYLYFSDVWQEKGTQKELDKRYFFPETDLTQNFNEQNTKKFNKKQIKKPNKNPMQKKNIILNKNKTNIYNSGSNKNSKNKKTNKQLNKLQKRLQDCKLDNNNNNSNKSKQSTKIKSELIEVFKQEDKMNSEMKEYCKRVEEQKRLREMFLERKEQRRKMLAMEKLGIKKESFTTIIG